MWPIYHVSLDGRDESVFPLRQCQGPQFFSTALFCVSFNGNAVLSAFPQNTSQVQFISGHCMVKNSLCNVGHVHTGGINFFFFFDVMLFDSSDAAVFKARLSHLTAGGMRTS